MADTLRSLFENYEHRTLSRRRLVQALGLAAVGAPFAAALGQGRCRLRLGAPGCDTTAINPVFEPTGWKTVALDHLTVQVADYRKEAAFFVALMGWKLRVDDGNQAVMDVGNWGTVVLKQAAPGTFPDSVGAGAAGGGRAGGGGRAPSRAVVESFCWTIEPWDAKKVESELRRRGLSPVVDNDGKGFESFHVHDPDGFDLQVSNGGGHVKSRRTAAAKTPSVAAPFDSTGWETVWLDHISFSVTNYKESASFYCSLLGWKPTYDEGSQNECMIGDVEHHHPRRKSARRQLRPRRGPWRRTRVSSASADRSHLVRYTAVGHRRREGREKKRGLRARVDTSTDDEIHVAAYKSYHTTTPNGFDLQISAVNHDTRLTLPTAVTPRRPPASRG
ncbi:MAG TPA: VOC family protein [Gemmatimonadaceae bacterium]|nr:VOC family protein [Gemmatimonadaceae bacterium]